MPDQPTAARSRTGPLKKAGSSSPSRRGGSPSNTLKKSTSERSLQGAKAQAKKKSDKKPGDHEGTRPPAKWVSAILEEINSRRAKHWTPPLVWNDECYVHARFQANACMAAKKKLRPNFVDNLDGMHGQLLAGPLKPPMQLNAANAERIVTQWYGELAKYDFSKPGPQPKARNFTQMLWGFTTSVGVALSSDGKFCVANFFPKGNGNPLDFPQCVLPVKKGGPPWEPHVPKAFKGNPLSEESWQRYEEAAAGLAEARRQRSLVMSRMIKPSDMVPCWPRPEEFFSRPEAGEEEEEEEEEEEDEAD
uniref:SCP domain-containing protein n=1 Tax=Alexandrium monilatum TaxID=311494 RepID=A0A7S4SUV4_9DINO